MRPWWLTNILSDPKQVLFLTARAYALGHFQVNDLCNDLQALEQDMH